MKMVCGCGVARVSCAVACLFSLTSALAESVWTTGSYADDGYVEVANRLKGGASGFCFDGKTTTYAEVSTGNSFSFVFDEATDLTDVRIYSTWGDTGRVGFKLANLQVKYDGSDEFVELADTGVDHHSSSTPSTNRLYAALASTTAGGCIVPRVTSLKIVFETCQNGYIGVAEIEVAGTPSVAETLTAQYLAAAGQYAVKLSATAKEYPLDVYFCSGATDGGTTVASWDRVEKAGTLTSDDSVVELAGSTDFAYCRAYFQSRRYGEAVWSDGLAVSVNPSVAVTVGERHTDSANLIAAVQSPGASSSSCDIYFACTPTGETMPAVALLKSGLAVGEAVTNGISGLSVSTSYDYKFVVRNAESGETVSTGTFSTLSAGVWTLSPFESTSDYEFPEDWLPHHNGTFATGQAVLPSGGNVKAGQELTFTFGYPKDIRRLDIYTLDSGRKGLGFANLQVMYDGAEDYVELPESALDYTAAVGKNGIRFSLVANGDFIVRNVVGIKIPVTQVHSGGTNVAALDAIGAPHDDTGEYKWDFKYVDGVNFQRPADLITDAKTSGIDANETDGVIATYSERYKGYSYEWTFEKPHDITSIGLFSNTDDANRNSFSVASVEIKHKGDTDYAALPAVPFDYFNRGSNIVSAVLRPTDRYIVRDVTAVKVTLGDKQSSWVPSFMAEVYVSGRQARKGLIFCIR